MAPEHPCQRSLYRVGIELGKSPYQKRLKGRIPERGCNLGFVSAGHGYFEDKLHGRQLVEAGSFLLQPRGYWHRFDPDPGTVWDEYWLQLRPEPVQAAFGDIVFKRPGVVMVGPRPDLIGLWRELYHAWPAYGARDPASAWVLLHRILFELRRAQQAAPLPTVDARMREADSWLRRRVTEAVIDLQGLAAELGMNYHAFRTAFKRHMGLAPKAYWLRLKMDRAEECLGIAGMSVTAVADYLGYDDPLYFSRQFKRIVGVAPSLYTGRGPSP
ncbi:MAG: AraC family transcriptional regulator [Planctomycetota bacterium]|jgi:AraC-like DNA-binding protein|nr:AraC family transcriptional regulator [Planctomycetota bacterium]